MNAHIRQHAPKATWIAAATAWTAVIAADTLNWPEHIWHCALVIAGVLSASAVLPALLGLQVSERIDRHYTAVAKGALRLSQPQPTPPPWRALRSVGADDDADALRNGRASSQ